MSVDLQPVHWLALLGLMVGVALLAMALFRCRGVELRALMVLLALACATPGALIGWVSWQEHRGPRLTAYRSFFDAIENGMTRADVMALRDCHYPPGGPRQPPRIMVDEADALTFFMHPEDLASQIDCEGILLQLKNGRVVKKTYSPD